MAIRVTASLLGVRETISVFRELRRDTHAELVGAIRETAKAVRRRAREDVRVDTGRLRRSISRRQSGLSARVFTRVPYANPLEARFPFMRPAGEAERARYEVEARRILRTAHTRLRR